MRLSQYNWSLTCQLELSFAIAYIGLVTIHTFCMFIGIVAGAGRNGLWKLGGSQDMGKDVGLLEKLNLRVKSTHLQFEIGLKFEIRGHVFCARW